MEHTWMRKLVLAVIALIVVYLGATDSSR